MRIGTITHKYSFPQDPDIKDKWIDATGKRNWFPTNYSRICSVHFNDGDFKSTTKRRTLNKSAIPTVNIWRFIGIGNPSDDRDFTSPTQPACEPTDPCASTTPSRKRGFRSRADKPQSTSATYEPGDSDTPRKKKLRLEIQAKHLTIAEQRLKIKRLQCKARRYRKKILKLKDLVKNLEDKRLITGDQAWSLENMNVTAQDLIGRFKQKLKSGKNIRTKFSPNLRSFAATLHFYSPKAYSFVRAKFNTCLPHVRTIKKWYQSVDAEPGFTMESLNAIKAKVRASKHTILCNLVLDEMAIRQRVEWDGKRMHGYVDVGTGSGCNDSSNIAKEALVFLITAINGAWKIPVAYFLIAGLSGEQKSHLVLQCLELLHTTGIEVTSLTFDGCPANISMAIKLGCSFDVDHMVTNFKHPVTKKPVNIFLDACHMVKLVRNSFESSGIFKDSEGQSVNWLNLVQLNELQEKEHLHLANKLRRTHILFKNNKMKVRLATQLMSNSVAEALRFCSQQNYPGFKDIDGTVTFLKNINNLFDILNSRSMKQIYYKKPLYFRNKDKTFSFLEKVEQYLKALKLANGQNVVKSIKKTGFIGLITCINSLKEMYIRLIENEKIINYLPAYKLSQDHIELTFGHIRAHGGCNNNPTARQFMSIYKKLITHVELKDFDSGNCVALENVSILSCSSAVDKINFTTVAPYHADNDDEDTGNETIFDDVMLSYDLSNMSEFGSQVVVYVAGSVVHYLLKKINPL